MWNSSSNKLNRDRRCNVRSFHRAERARSYSEAARPHPTRGHRPVGGKEMVCKAKATLSQAALPFHPAVYVDRRDMPVPLAESFISHKLKELSTSPHGWWCCAMGAPPGAAPWRILRSTAWCSSWAATPIRSTSTALPPSGCLINIRSLGLPKHAPVQRRP